MSLNFIAAYLPYKYVTNIFNFPNHKYSAPASASTTEDDDEEIEEESKKYGDEFTKVDQLIENALLTYPIWSQEKKEKYSEETRIRLIKKYLEKRNHRPIIPQELYEELEKQLHEFVSRHIVMIKKL